MIKNINLEDENLLDDDDVVNPTKSNKNGEESGNKSPKLPKPPSTAPLKQDKGIKRKAISSIEEYAKKLETDNRTLESYFLLQLINQMPSKPMSFCSIMAFDSFKVYHKLMNAINIDLLESSVQKDVSLPLEVNKYVDFGIINKGNSLLRIYSLYAGNRYRGVKILVPAGAEFPSMRIPDWK
uniref:Uncharacterized protein n=1 Tax=Strongyloides papillosus TaxID=174720 RepID=A0A0N5B2D4_STREA